MWNFRRTGLCSQTFFYLTSSTNRTLQMAQLRSCEHAGSSIACFFIFYVTYIQYLFIIYMFSIYFFIYYVTYIQFEMWNSVYWRLGICKHSSFAVLSIKLWLEENSDLNRNDPLYSFKFIQSKDQNWYKMLSSFSYDFISNIANMKIFAYL